MRVAAAMLLVLSAFATARGQVAKDHEKHHPAAAPGSTPPPAQAAPGVASTPSMTDSVSQDSASRAAAGRMGEGMCGMMGGEHCGTGGGLAKALYPSMMQVPELTRENRQEFERIAGQYMLSGSTIMMEAFGMLNAAALRSDVVAMQDASAQVREGLAQFESGVSLRRAMAEGRSPQDVALGWFRREMNLTAMAEGPPPHGLFGLSWFHYAAMFILAAFAVTMIALNGARMRRADALVARLVGETAAPPLMAEGLASPPPEMREPAPDSLAVTTPTVSSAQQKQNAWTGLLRVVRIFRETPTVKSFRLAHPTDSTLPFTFLPGQFLTVTVTPGDQPVKRSYTIASSPTLHEACEITVKRDEHGAVSRFLHDRVKEGDTVQVTAASGRFTMSGTEASSIVMIAGGVGVTPMMSIVRYLTARSWSGDMFLFYAVNGEVDVIYREELEYLQRRYPNLHVVIVAERVESSSWPHRTGRITRALLEEHVPELRSRRIHICGPPPMMDAVKAILADVGVPAEQIRTEVFIGKEKPATPPEATLAADVKVAVVTFAKSRKTAMMSPTKSLLEASEDVGVDIDFSCRVGTCGVCKTRLLSGVVTQEVQDALEPADVAAGIVLACQAMATTDITVDA